MVVPGCRKFNKMSCNGVEVAQRLSCCQMKNLMRRIFAEQEGQDRSKDTHPHLASWSKASQSPTPERPSIWQQDSAALLRQRVSLLSQVLWMTHVSRMQEQAEAYTEDALLKTPRSGIEVESSRVCLSLATPGPGMVAPGVAKRGVVPETVGNPEEMK